MNIEWINWWVPAAHFESWIQLISCPFIKGQGQGVPEQIWNTWTLEDIRNFSQLWQSIKTIIVNCQLSIVNCQPSIVNCQLSTIDRQLPIVAKSFMSAKGYRPGSPLQDVAAFCDNHQLRTDGYQFIFISFHDVANESPYIRVYLHMHSCRP